MKLNELNYCIYLGCLAVSVAAAAAAAALCINNNIL